MKSFGMFLLLVVFIAVFAIVVMVQVPRKGVVMEDPAGDSMSPVSSLARTDELPDGVNVKSLV